MINVRIITDDQTIPLTINPIDVIIDWQCSNCYRADRLVTPLKVLPKCNKLTDDGTICKRQIIKI